MVCCGESRGGTQRLDACERLDGSAEALPCSLGIRRGEFPVSVAAICLREFKGRDMRSRSAYCFGGSCAGGVAPAGTAVISTVRPAPAALLV
jgi:hypothetical protein